MSNYYFDGIKSNPKKYKKFLRYTALKVREWRERNRDKYLAHNKVRVAVRNGSLKKTSCSCGKKKVEAHHEDYSKPLEITWLCRKHHLDADKKRRSRILSTCLVHD